MIKVGTDFSGIGSPEAALKRLNIPHHNVFACDIDKYAKKSFLELNKPDNFYEDITKRDYKEVPQLDLYVAGFPCQSFSLAGQRKGFNETRGTLFFNVAEFIKVNQPECFILENVKGLLSHDSGKTYQTITDVLTNGGGTLNGQIGINTINDGLGYHVYTQVLNTKDYGIPQNRERIFIVGFKYYRVFRFPKKITLKLSLKDILEQQVPEKYYLSDKAKDKIKRHKNKSLDNEVSNTIHAGYYKQGGRDQQYIPVEDKYYLSEKRANAALFPTDNSILVHSLYPRSSKTNKGGTGHLSKQDGTTYCLDTGNNQAIEIKGAALRGRGKGKELEVRKDNLVNSITTVQTDSIIKQNNIRRLTPLECWRLQGFTDEEFYKAQKVNSDSQLYKQAGNSITVNVMTAILKKIYLS